MISAFVMPEQVELFHGKLTLSIRSPLFFFWLLANDFTYNTDWLFVKFLIYIYCYQHHGFAFSLCIQLSFIEHHQHKPLVRIILLCSGIFAEHRLRTNFLVRTKTANCSMCNCSVFESIMSYSCSHARRLSDFVLEQTCVAFIIPVVLLQSTISFLVSEWCWWFYQAHSTWSKFQFTGWCVLDKLKCNVLQFIRYNILPTGQTLNLSCYDLWI